MSLIGNATNLPFRKKYRVFEKSIEIANCDFLLLWIIKTNDISGDKVAYLAFFLLSYLQDCRTPIYKDSCVGPNYGVDRTMGLNPKVRSTP